MRVLARAFAALVFLFAGLGVMAAEPQEIGWKDLLPETQTYDDPFADLGAALRRSTVPIDSSPRRAVHLDVQIDPVQQWPGDLIAVG